MRKFILKRLGYAVLSLFLLSFTIFFFVRVTGDPTTLLVEPGASREDIAALQQQLGLDRPVWVQSGSFVPNPARGAFRRSFYYRTAVIRLYRTRWPTWFPVGRR